MLIALKSAHKAHSMSYHHAMIRNISSDKEEKEKVGGKGRVDWGQHSYS